MKINRKWVGNSISSSNLQSRRAAGAGLLRKYLCSFHFLVNTCLVIEALNQRLRQGGHDYMFLAAEE